MLEIKITVTQMKNAFNRLFTRLNKIEGKKISDVEESNRNFTK